MDNKINHNNNKRILIKIFIKKKKSLKKIMVPIKKNKIQNVNKLTNI